jgi:hypothetical protein
MGIAHAPAASWPKHWGFAPAADILTQAGQAAANGVQPFGVVNPGIRRCRGCGRKEPASCETRLSHAPFAPSFLNLFDKYVTYQLRVLPLFPS